MEIKKILQGKRILFILLFQFSYIIPALNCSTPVFRYALERWQAYSYIVEVIHNGNLNDSQQHALEYLKSSADSGVTANLRVIETSASESSEIENQKLPLIRLFYPKEHKVQGVVWQGALTEENVKKLVDSPSRQKAISRIEKGDAAVWFYLESGDKSQDNKLAELLKNELKQLSQELKLSTSATDASGNPLDINIVNSDVTFSMVKLSRTDPAEEIFVKMLLGTESDLASYHTPLAFPVFGRGRALYALVGKGIKHKLIKSTCNTIIGWCSCTIKEDNPGTDLLFKADWDKIMGDTTWIQKEEIPEITGLTDFITIEDEEAAVVETPVETEKTEERIHAKKEIIDIAIAKTSAKTLPKRVEEIKEVKEIKESEISEGTPSVIPESDKSFFSPLLRNILLVILLLLILVPTISFLLKRKANK